MILKTFRFKLAILYTSVVVVIFSFFAAIIFIKYKSQLYEGIDKYLLAEAKTDLIHDFKPEQIKRNEEIIKKYGDEYFEILNVKGEVLIASLDTGNQRWAMNMALLEKAFQGTHGFDTVIKKGESVRVLYFPVSKERIIRIGQSLHETEKGVSSLKKLLVISLPFIFTISAGISWFLAGMSLAPVIKIKTLAEKIRHGKFGERIDIGVRGKEIDDLVTIVNEMLESIQRSMETQKRFTADVSHEIRSPLTSLRGNIEVALRKQRTPEEYEDILETSLADVIRLSKITDNLLFLTKADNKILELRKQWFPIKQLLENVLEHLRSKIHSAGLTLIEDYQDNLEFYGDIFLLEQALANIVGNAIKYTPTGGKINIKTEKQYNYLFITISDTGIGIPEPEIPHVFERFYRVDKERSRKSGGTGLGLSIAQWIVNEHKGKILVKSAVGAGSEFTVVLPKQSE